MQNTPLAHVHKKLGARMVDFHGWSMPVSYSGLMDEHARVRTECGIFDVSHMGRIRLLGAGAEQLLEKLFTRKTAGMKPGRARYGLMCNRDGGVIDDLLTYRLAEGEFLLVVNASNRENVLAWVERGKNGISASVADETFDTGMIACQGPSAERVLQRISDADLNGLKRFRFLSATVAGHQAMVSRTGYTGEDGFEICAPAGATEAIWQGLLDGGAAPCGLGARDTLRLEAALPLYGNELNTDITPLEAGLEVFVDLEDRDFVGAEALRRQKASGLPRMLVGLESGGRRIPRSGCAILHGGDAVGVVTSGTFSPTLKKNIALAYVPVEHRAEGTEFEIDIRGTRVPATVVEVPFYRRNR